MRVMHPCTCCSPSCATWTSQACSQLCCCQIQQSAQLPVIICVEVVRDAGTVRPLHARLDCMLCRMLEDKLTHLHQALTQTACQALLCGTDCQLLIHGGVVTADSIDFHISMIGTSTNTLCYSVKMSRICVKKGCQSGHVVRKHIYNIEYSNNNDLVNDAAHGISGSCAMGQISLQRSQPILNTIA